MEYEDSTHNSLPSIFLLQNMITKIYTDLRASHYSNRSCINVKWHVLFCYEYFTFDPDWVSDHGCTYEFLKLVQIGSQTITHGRVVKGGSDYMRL